MKAIVIYEASFSGGGWDYEETAILDVIAVTDDQLKEIDLRDLVHKGQNCAVVELKQARVESKNVLVW